MATDWDNDMDRRTGPTSRRKSDIHCPEHFIRWEHHDNDAKEHRGIVCGKIRSISDAISGKADADDLKIVQGDLRSMTPWKVFALAMLIIIAMTGWTHKTIMDGQDKMTRAVETIHRRISETDQDNTKLQTSINDLHHSLNAIANRLYNVEQQLHKK